VTTTEIAIKNCEEITRNITCTDAIFFILQLVPQNKDNYKVCGPCKEIGALFFKANFYFNPPYTDNEDTG